MTTTTMLIMLSTQLHMWLVGRPNHDKMEQSWECTFLKLFIHMKTKFEWKKNHHWTSELLASMHADPANQGGIGRVC